MTDWTFRGILGALFVLLISLSIAHSQQAGDAAPAAPPQVDKAAQKAQAQKILDESFGPAIRDAKASRDVKDDLALAQRLLDLAPSHMAHPALLALLCENAYQLAQKDPAGTETAVKAMTYLAQTLPEEAPEALANIVTLRRKMFNAARREEKSSAAKQLINALVWQGEYEADRKDANAALVSYRAALPLAATYHPKDRDALNEIITRLSAQTRIEKQIETLKAKIKADGPDRDAAAQELLQIYIAEYDDPKAAAEYAFVTTDVALKNRIKLAQEPATALTAEQARQMGDWYLDLSEKAKTPASKSAMLHRARECYEQFLAKSPAQDLTSAKIKLLVEKLSDDLKKLGLAGPAARVASARIMEMDLGGGLMLALARIEPGEFLMGSPVEEEGRYPTEPQHKVKIEKPFYMGVFEVTQAQYKAIMGANPSAVTGADDLPVESVNWYDAVDFCKKLSEKTGKRFRLPTEAEWEYACRAGTTTPFNFGATIDAADANYKATETYGGGAPGIFRRAPFPVGTLKKPNRWGLHDMHGNVMEWCYSVPCAYPYRADDGRDEPDDEVPRVLRGGSFTNSPRNCRSALRSTEPPKRRDSDRGFRVVMDVPGPGGAPENVAAVDPSINAESRRVRSAFKIASEFTDGTKFTVVRIESGEFMMGSAEGEEGRRLDEPRHKVRIEEPFFMATTEVTQNFYRNIMGVNPSHFRGDGELPVEMVSWEEAVEFCRKLSKKSGNRFRLPTEAEWEYACRAGTTTPFSFGATLDASEVNYKADDVYGGGVRGENRRATIAVASLKKPNRWDLHDMHGNVWEWCSSVAMPYPYRADDGREAPAATGNRVMRGGAWVDTPDNCRSSNRRSRPATSRYNGVGFRVVMDMPAPGTPIPRGAAPPLPPPDERSAPPKPGAAAPAHPEVKTLDFDLGGGVALKLAPIRAGAFMMGSPDTEERSGEDERQHSVTIKKPFHIGIHEVTQAQYRAIIGQNPSRFTGDLQRPVDTVNWEDARAFCRKLSEKTGKKFRLPTEAEWEYACRAGTTTPFYFGKTISPDQVNFDANYTYGGSDKGLFRNQTLAVGSLGRPNAWGLHDMHGNIWEWCSSMQMNYPYRADDGREEEDPGVRRVIRGGSWNSWPARCRSAERPGYAPDSRRRDIGFRVVMESDN